MNEVSTYRLQTSGRRANGAPKSAWLIETRAGGEERHLGRQSISQLYRLRDAISDYLDDFEELTRKAAPTNV
ncbi:hypothetical protein [Gordonia sp. (in: high G+C Gram-positive bacteria)]|uniref:hypothetical protein n=1 Tax=Gordonia sp. (in: high G+C Gram-positive bacteria) TaxID=84139 RepID=UPI003C72E212